MVSSELHTSDTITYVACYVIRLIIFTLLINVLRHNDGHAANFAHAAMAGAMPMARAAPRTPIASRQQYRYGYHTAPSSGPAVEASRER